MKITEMFRNNEIVLAIAVMEWAFNHGYTIESIRAEMIEIDEMKKRPVDADKIVREEIRDRINTDPERKKKLPICPNDGFVMNIRESEVAESELYCPDPECGHLELLDISILEWNTRLSTAMTGKEPDFDPDEIKVSKEEREARRKVCGECEHLDGMTCKKCGCDYKHRTYYEILTCPDGRW